MKILPKGLILVSVPLIFGIGFVLLLFNGLADADRLIQRELALKDAIISYITAARCTSVANRCFIVYKNSNSQFYKQTWQSNQNQATAATEHLKALLKSDPSLPIPPLEFSAAPQVPMRGSLDKDLSELCRLALGQKLDLAATSETLLALEHQSDVQTKAALSAMNSLQATLHGGVVAELLISIALTIFFCFSITNRLNMIMANTLSLSKGTTLNPPVKGGDEIAELDQFIFKSATEIRALERFKSDMVGVVSQELSTPLNSVGQFLFSLSAGKFGPLSEKAQLRVEGTCKSVKRLIGLIADLLSLNRLELEIRPAKIDVNELITASVDAVKELAGHSGIEIVVKSRGGTVFADHDRLIQVIVNLLSNAVKFSPPKGRVTIETIEHDGWFECRVSDQGRGIPEAFRKQIFEPFMQVDAKDAITKKGTGLGLTISRSIVERHGGIIGVDSEEGRGTTFWYKIPVVGSNQLFPGNPGQDQAGKSSSIEQNKRQSKRKFSVLMQGLVIISLPLLFQFIFVCVIAYQLEQSRQHTHQEEKSKKILVSLNRMSDEYIDSVRFAIMYVYTKNNSFKESFQADMAKALAQLDQAKQLSAAEPKQVQDLEKIRGTLEKFSSVLDGEATRLDKLNATSELRPFFKQGSAPTPEQFQSLILDHARQRALVHQIETLFRDKTHVGILFDPFLETHEAQERVMAREKAIGENSAVQRAMMINVLNLTFFLLLVWIILLSVVLVIFLMKSLTSRLRHVMENTARIIKREGLDPPKKGIDDEIAYLDQVLFEIGNHIIELENFKKGLVAIVSHELRTPLMSVCSLLELLGAGVLGQLSERAQERLTIAEIEAVHLVRLINDLLDIEKMEAGQFILDKIEFKLVDIIEPTTAAVARLAEAKQVIMNLDGTNGDLKVWADRDRLCKALINLLSNGIESSPRNGTVNVSVQDTTAEIEFRVIDHGAGIPEEQQAKIFDRFVQVQTSDRCKYHRSGLSLAITRAIIEQHGGTIGVDSEIGTGNTFWFKLPLNQADFKSSPGVRDNTEPTAAAK